MSYVYILKNEAGRYYIGYTKQLEERLLAHQDGRGNWTADRGPWTLVYYEQFASDTDARSREIKLKRAKNKNYISWLCTNGPGRSVG